MTDIDAANEDQYSLGLPDAVSHPCPSTSMTPSKSHFMAFLPDPVRNRLSAPGIELDSIVQQHFGTVIPKLRALLPNAMLQKSLRLWATPQDNHVYARTYIGLLLLSLSNGVAALDCNNDLPLSSMFHYLQFRFTTDQLYRFVTHLPRASSKAFGESLLRCAMEARSVSVVDFLLTERLFDLDVDQIMCYGTLFEPITLIQRAFELRSVSLMQLLLAKGANMHKTLAGFREYSRGYAGDRELFRDSTSTSVLHVLLCVAPMLSNELLKGLLNRAEAKFRPQITEDHRNDEVEALEAIVCYGAPIYHHEWIRNGTYLRIIRRLHATEAERLFTKILELGLDFGCDHDARYDANMMLARQHIVDAFAGVSSPNVLIRLREHGARLTDSTMISAIESANIDVIAYLVEEGITGVDIDPSAENIRMGVGERPRELGTLLHA